MTSPMLRCLTQEVRTNRAPLRTNSCLKRVEMLNTQEEEEPYDTEQEADAHGL